MRGHGLDRALKPRQDPAVLDPRRVGAARLRRCRGCIQEDQSRRVPHLVGEVLALLDSVRRVAHVLARRHRQQAEADRVGAVRVDLVERVDAGAEALRHPPPVGRLDHRGDVDVVEGDLAGELEPHHHHPGHPEEDDVARRDQHVGGVEGAQLRRLVGPAEDRERPQRGAEPGVEHVLVLAQLAAAGAAALRAASRRRRSPRRRRSTRPAAGGPTRAGARCTRAGCCASSRGRRASTARGRSAPRSARRPRSRAPRARPCGRTTAARSAARSARPSGARRGPSARTAPRRGSGPRSRSAATTASCASAAVRPREPLPRLRRSSGRPRRSR